MEVIDVHKKNLIALGYKDLEDWLKASEKHVYIGRRIHWVPATTQSKWANPFGVKRYTREGCIDMYKVYLTDKGLIHDINELKGCVLGCWCHPEPCHGHVLVSVLNSAKEADSGSKNE